MGSTQKIIYTIGHSTHSIEEFVEMLQTFKVELVADVRRLPGSRKYPQFDKQNLMLSLPQNGISYQHFEDLGGRRKMAKDSKNDRWRNNSFRGYADYMETPDFAEAVATLENAAQNQVTAYMCAEAVWWRCHRSMISDWLKAKGWTVLHIIGNGKIQEHPYTSPAIVNGDEVSYSDET